MIGNFPVPFVKEASIKIGLKLREALPLTVNDTKVIIGEIELIQLDESLIGEDVYVDLEKAGSITCTGLDSYHRTQKIGRLAYAKPGQEPREL
jgi:flavin reductase (DIM6/NTAB) family NADH-FMN oxidoreductase RutF